VTAKRNENKLMPFVAPQKAPSIPAERRRGEQRREAYWAEAQRLSHTGSFGWQVSSGEIYWSEETFRIFEFEIETHITLERIFERIHPEDRQLARQEIDSATRDRKGFDFEHRLLMPDTSVRYVRVAGHPSSTRDESGELEFVGAVTDITERRRGEEKLRQSEAELRQVVEAIPQQVLVLDSSWGTLFANSRELEFTGLTPQEAQSENRVARIFHPEDLKKREVIRERALSDGSPFEWEARIRRRDGQYRWFLIRYNPLRDEQGRVLRWYCTRTDIEDRKQMGCRQLPARRKFSFHSVRQDRSAGMTAAHFPGGRFQSLSE
jgi:PAS domain S-box-containing protein